jgi:hypothetical protein
LATFPAPNDCFFTTGEISRIFNVDMREASDKAGCTYEGPRASRPALLTIGPNYLGPEHLSSCDLSYAIDIGGGCVLPPEQNDGGVGYLTDSVILPDGSNILLTGYAPTGMSIDTLQISANQLGVVILDAAHSS